MRNKTGWEDFTGFTIFKGEDTYSKLLTGVI